MRYRCLRPCSSHLICKRRIIERKHSNDCRAPDAYRRDHTCNHIALFEDWVIDWTTTLILALSYTIIVPSLIATWIWFSLIARIGATEASTFHFLNPFFGVAIAALILEETMTFSDYLGVIIISFGILAVQNSKKQNHKGTPRT